MAFFNMVRCQHDCSIEMPPFIYIYIYMYMYVCIYCLVLDFPTHNGARPSNAWALIKVAVVKKVALCKKIATTAAARQAARMTQ